MAKNITYLTEKHPLVGVWQGTEDDARSQYTIVASPQGFDVYAVDIEDGEEFIISDIEWDGNVLVFKSHMPSTGRLGTNSFHLHSLNEAEVTFTFTETYIWRRVDE